MLSDLYRDHHLLPLQAFARTLGMGLRVQPYGLETDTVEHAALLDIPETESLGFKNLDDYRVMAGGRDMAGHTILSCEAICYNGAAYNTTLGGNSASPTQQNQALLTLNSIFAAGVNQAMIHGFPYADAPGVTWPGFAAFSPYYNGAIGYGEAWGPRTPQWQHMPDVAGVPRPHPARAADRHAAVRRRLPAAEGLDVHRHRRLRGRPTTASRSAGPTPSRRRPCSTCRGRRSAVAGSLRTARRTRR